MHAQTCDPRAYSHTRVLRLHIYVLFGMYLTSAWTCQGSLSAQPYHSYNSILDL